MLSKMAEYRFRQPKSVEDEERCVLNAIPKSMRYKNIWAARIFEEWGKARFPKVATLEPGGLFKEYDLHKVQSLEIPLLQMDALSVKYWLWKKLRNLQRKDIHPKRYTSLFVDYVALWRRTMKSWILILSMLRIKGAILLLFVALVIICSESLISIVLFRVILLCFTGSLSFAVFLMQK